MNTKLRHALTTIEVIKFIQLCRRWSCRGAICVKNSQSETENFLDVVTKLLELKTLQYKKIWNIALSHFTIIINRLMYIWTANGTPLSYLHHDVTMQQLRRTGTGTSPSRARSSVELILSTSVASSWKLHLEVQEGEEYLKQPRQRELARLMSPHWPYSAPSDGMADHCRNYPSPSPTLHRYVA